MTRVSKLPKRLQPMLATLIDAPFDSPDWVFESKWDGFRVVASIEGGKLTLYSRNGEVVSDRYPPVAKALAPINHDALIDGELVALDAQEDEANKSNCYGDCAKAWPPYMAAADAKAEGEWTIVERSDGTKMWAYEGKPLYTYAEDKKAGDVTGDGKGDVWHVAKVD